MADLTHIQTASASHPFSDLGAFMHADGTFFRFCLPGANAVDVIALDGSVLSQCKRVADGIFTGNTSLSVSQYLLNVTTQDTQYQIYDPYAFKDEAYHAVHFVDHLPQNVYEQLGAQIITIDLDNGEQISAVRFAVFAPNAQSVSVVAEFNLWNDLSHQMQKTDMGYWVLVIPQATVGDKYKYAIKDEHGHSLPHKADPVGFSAEQYPSHASKIIDHNAYQWTDSKWMNRQNHDPYHQPMSIYEVQLASWKRPHDDRRYLTYRELAVDLVKYVVDMGYTHIELMPISEYPFDGSWGYQPVGLFAPTSRFGSVDDFKYFVDACHLANIGVIIDWVPAHFPEDGHGLARFDGTCVYEYEDPRKGWHPDWNSCIYDFGKSEVRQFLVANALFWCDKFHIDGLRVDAVASMLYLDYSRNDGEWIPNVDGGNHNYEAISLLRWVNQAVYAAHPNVITIAEESTSFARVSRPVDMDGLGFGFKWNMGWMHDSLHYIAKDPAYRRYHHNDITFSMMYAFDENFVLPISHDEVVYGKGSLLGKMPGDEWQQAANLRTYAGFMYAHPGKKLNFMGNEFAQFKEWDHDGELDWELLQHNKHQQVQHLYQTLNTLYKEFPALHACDHEHHGFAWLTHDDAERSILSFLRYDPQTKQTIYVLCNFTPIPVDQVRIGLDKGTYSVLLNTDDTEFGGSGYMQERQLEAQHRHSHGKDYSIELTLPPLSTMFWIKQD